jgi:hypothetical protein
MASSKHRQAGNTRDVFSPTFTAVRRKTRILSTFRRQATLKRRREVKNMPPPPHANPSVRKMEYAASIK